MYSDLNSKVILVSALPSIVAMEDKEEQELKIGSTLEDCVVQHSINGKGLILSAAEQRLFCPMCRITDKSSKQILKSKKYTVLSKHQVRLVKYDAVSSIYIVDMRESVLTLPYFSTSELSIGSRVECVVDRAQDKGLVVRSVRARSARILIISLTSMRTSLSEVLERQFTRITYTIQITRITQTQ